MKTNEARDGNSKEEIMRKQDEEIRSEERRTEDGTMVQNNKES